MRSLDHIRGLADEICRVPENQRTDSSALRELGSLVVDLFEVGRTQELQPAFDLAELLITTGLEAEKEAAVVGFLETVQNVASHRPCGSVVFERFLEPGSSAAWVELAEVWGSKTSLAEVVAFETGASLGRPWWQFWSQKNARTVAGSSPEPGAAEDYRTDHQGIAHLRRAIEPG